ncbi:MAG TPA: methyltransferase domain-containing protein [Blastocatellia bacterium]|nr:methyltransferase domain-containing protein [Blastocatellia bacterium]
MQPKAFTFLRPWVFFSGLGAWVLAVVLALRGELLWAGVFAVFALGADVAGRVWSRRSPVPMPYFMRWVLLLPRGPHSPKNLERVLQPRSGERILEIGPGVGVHALPVASLLLPNGVLDVLDVQQDMLDNLARRAASSGLTNIRPKQGDAQKLPYPDRTFDAAYLIGVLGEIPDSIVAMCELKRVLKPGGRLVISELLIDPDFISLSALQEKARYAGFVLEQSVGSAFAYSAVLRPAASKQSVAAASPLDARCSTVLRSKEDRT